MRFKEFWPLYLRAHRLPGTRGMHYFATAVGIMAAIEALATGQPLIFVLGIAVSYAIAIVAHWFVERNQPLIKVNAFWGAVADIRMCCLALTGQLGREFARHGVAQPILEASARPMLRHGGPYARYALLIASAAGLVVGLLDLYDLMEPMEVLALPIIQLGTPIIAFAGALIAALATLFVARRYSQVLIVATGSPGSNMADGAVGGGAGTSPESYSASERSLRRACLALLAFGLAAFGLAELIEHGIPEPVHLYGALAALVMLVGVGIALVWHLDGTWHIGRVAGSPPDKRRWQDARLLGPETRGIRVDGRVWLVDALENLISLGRRRAILTATLEAAELRPGDRLVDVGCGSGELVQMAAQIAARHSHQQAGEAIGIDATPGMIEIARQRACKIGAGVRFEVAAAEALPLPDESVQAVTSSFFFHHLPPDVKRDALREMWRVLAPGGRLVITDYGWARGFVGLIASFPMRFNFHEYVRGQIDGELERIIERESLGAPQVARVFLGYIRVLRIIKPHRDASRTRPV